MAIYTETDLIQRIELLEAENAALRAQLAAIRAAAFPVTEPLSKGWAWTNGGHWFIAYRVKDTRCRHVLTSGHFEALARVLGVEL